MNKLEQYLQDNSLSISYDVSQADVDCLWNGIIEYNTTIGPMSKYSPYGPYRILLKDKNDKIIAGILNRISLKAIYVELLWISEEYRKKSIGSILLNKVEEHGRNVGCKFIHLDTYSFQAIDFYKRYGYEVFACLEDYPEDVKRYFLKKQL